MTRRQALQVATTAMAATAAEPLDAALLQRNDEYVEGSLRSQNLNAKDPWYGGLPDAYGLHHPNTCAGFLEAGTAAFVTSGSKHHRSKDLLQRMRLAAAMMRRYQLPSGNSLLLISNYDSAPDTAFMTYGVAGSVRIARDHKVPEIEALTAEWRKQAARGLTNSGVHTPNHRWVVCSALALLHSLDPQPALLRRIDQWLAESIDIDDEGQYTERSSGIYNMVNNRALIVLAHHLKRPELLEPVRRNLNAMLYLVHPDGELVTEISRRQDQGTHVGLNLYWPALQYMAAVDQNPQWGALAKRYHTMATLPYVLQYPQMSQSVPEGPVPDRYEKVFPSLGVARIRRGDTSATLMLKGDSRIFHLRNNGAIIDSVRFASAFFGKAQFVPEQGTQQGKSYVLTQQLEAGYYQPFTPPRRITPANYDSTREQRRRTEICKLEQRATATETAKGFRLRLQAHGTDNVPLAVEVHLRPGAQFQGAEAVPKVQDTFLLRQGYATVRSGQHAIRFGPGRAEHAYTQARGAQPKMPGPSIYLTGYTPFDHTIEFEVS